MVQAGIKNIKNYNPHKAQMKFKERYGKAPHVETIQRYVSVLEVFGFVTIEDGFLTFRRIKSQNNERNYLVEVEDSIDIKHLGREISKFIISSSMRAIGYVKNLIKKRESVENLDELKHIEAKIRRLGFDYDRFTDNGVSYDLLCDRFHICRHTVSALLKKCIECGIIGKVRIIIKETVDNALMRFGNIPRLLHNIDFDYTYFYYDNRYDVLRLYKVYANQYVYNYKCKEEYNYCCSL